MNKVLVVSILSAVLVGMLSVGCAQNSAAPVSTRAAAPTAAAPTATAPTATAPTATAPAAKFLSQHWSSINGDLTTDEGTQRYLDMLKTCKDAGVTHVMVHDGRFWRLDEQKPEYLQNIQKVKAAAKEMSITLVCSTFHIGYGGGYFHYDGNIAAGLPVKNMVFVVKDGKGTPDMAAALDASTLKIEGKNLVGSYTVKPFTSYRISYLTTAKQATGEGREDVLRVSSAKRWHSRSNPVYTKQGDKLLVQTIFNTLDAEKINVSISDGDKASDVKIVPAGTLLIVRRKLVPLTVTSADGKTTYEEGKDFKPVFDEAVNKKPHPGEFPIDHEGSPIELTADSKIKDGDKLLVSFWHTQRIYNDQDHVSMEDPQVFKLMEQDVSNGVKAWGTDVGWFMGYDEVRMGGWEPQPDGKERTPGQEMAEHFKKGYELVRKYSPKAQIYTWSDMFTPYHNAGKGKENYYLVKGNWYGSWEGMPSDVIILNWYVPKDKEVEAMKFFADKGHAQIVCGYYDEPATAKMKANIDHWFTVSRGIPNVVGIMYTTFANNYKAMPEYFKLVDTYDQWAEHKTGATGER